MLSSLSKWFCALTCLSTGLSLWACSDTGSESPDPVLPDLATLPPSWADGLAPGVNQGISQHYLEDSGLVHHPAVLAVETFESGAVTIPTQEDRYAKHVEVTAEQAYMGQYSAKHSWVQDYNGPTTRFTLPDSMHAGDHPTYFVRMCLRYDSSFHPKDLSRAVGVKGFGIYFENGSGNANTCDGMSWYNVSCQFVGWGPSVKPMANDSFLWVGHQYSYTRYPRTAVADVGEIQVTEPADGTESCRFSSYATPFTYLKFNEWYCYELGLYLNTPGVADGEARFWIDGVLQSRVRGMWFREKEQDVPTSVQLNLHRTTQRFEHPMFRWADNIVIANRYIGPPQRKPTP